SWGEIGDDERRIGALHLAQALRRSARLADHTEVGFQLDQRVQALAQDPMRLDDHDVRACLRFEHQVATPCRRSSRVSVGEGVRGAISSTMIPVGIEGVLGETHWPSFLYGRTLLPVR